MQHRLGLLFVGALIGCAEPASPRPPTLDVARSGSQAPPASSSQLSPLVVLATEHLDGFAILGPTARIASSIDEARKARDRAQGENRSGDAPPGPCVKVLEDRGEAIRVTTDIGQLNGFPSVDSDEVIEGIVLKSTLSPVVRAPLVASYADGTGYVLHPGLELVLSGRTFHAVDPRVDQFTTSIPEANAGLTFDPTAQPPAPSDASNGARKAPLLGCIDTSTRHDTPRVLDADGLRAARAEPETGAFGATVPGKEGEFPRCALSAMVSNLRIDGRALGGISFRVTGCEDPPEVLTTVRAADHRVLVAIPRRRATLWAITDESSLVPFTGCHEGGSIGLGGVTRPPANIVVGDVRVYFSDGQPAGHHRADKKTTFRDGAPQSDRICRSVRHIAGVLCYAVEDVR